MTRRYEFHSPESLGLTEAAHLVWSTPASAAIDLPDNTFSLWYSEVMAGAYKLATDEEWRIIHARADALGICK